MYKSVFLCVLLFISSYTPGQDHTPADVVEAQLKAYNDRDIDAFMAVFHQEVELWALGGEAPVAKGFDNVKELYINLFEKSPKLHSTVINRSVISNKVIDYEIITGRNDDDAPLYLVMVYEIKDGKIFRAYSIRE